MKNRTECLIIGIGNEFRRDDAIGLLLARKLQQMSLPNVTIQEASGEGGQLMELWKGFSKVILLDALSSKGKPGTIQRFEAHREPLPSESFRYSTHAFSIGEAIELARAIGGLPESCIVYGIEGKIFEAGVGLSREVEDNLEEMLDRIFKDLE